MSDIICLCHVIDKQEESRLHCFEMGLDVDAAPTYKTKLLLL